MRLGSWLQSSLKTKSDWLTYFDSSKFEFFVLTYYKFEL